MHTKLQCRVGYYQFADSFISTANLSNRPINCYYRRWSTVSRRDFPTGGGVNKREGPAPPPPDKSDRAAVMLIYTDSSPEPTPPSPIVHLEFNVSTMVGLHGGKVNEGRDRGSTFTGGGGEGGEFGIGILFPASRGDLSYFFPSFVQFLYYYYYYYYYFNLTLYIRLKPSLTFANLLSSTFTVYFYTSVITRISIRKCVV
jgi:hypothetical protein